MKPIYIGLLQLKNLKEAPKEILYQRGKRQVIFLNKQVLYIQSIVDGVVLRIVRQQYRALGSRRSNKE